MERVSQRRYVHYVGLEKGIDPEIRESILGHWFEEKSVVERYGSIGESEIIRAVDSMTFDHGETEIWVRKEWWQMRN